MTGASHRNWSSYEMTSIAAGAAGWRRHLLTDPQTSVGFVAPRPSAATRYSARSAASIVGHAEEGGPAIKVEA